ncbi:MAG TPA: caspase family protein [Nostocaceae cyanobacterium]|nr:caspase family protein [Nostocaceae cyanobacterium]
MNIAIILAVSDYPQSPLPGCIADGELMNSLLELTGKYTEILFINQNTNSTFVKEKLSKFIANYQNQAIDEFLFYYTGHGDFNKGEFYYILSDYNQTKHRQTSLSNSELDNFIRQLNPKLTVKIVDACHAGVTYIKDNEVIQKQLNNTKEGFNNCYFLFSSLLEQSSHQDNYMSFFTKSLFDSILQYEGEDIRYKDIIDYISDDFDRNSLQTPFFVTQAKFTEIFVSISLNIKNSLSNQMNKILNSGSINKDENQPTSIVELVKKEAESYCSQEEVMEILNNVKDIVKSHVYSSDIQSLYEINNIFGENYYNENTYDYNFGAIGKWLADYGNSYFATECSTKNYGDHISEEIYGINLTVDTPFKLIEINAIPLYPNIDKYSCAITFIFSQINIRFFYTYSVFKLETWQNYTHEFSLSWSTIEIEMKKYDKLKHTISRFLNDFELFIMDCLKSQYNLSVDSNDNSLDNF